MVDHPVLALEIGTLFADFAEFLVLSELFFVTHNGDTVAPAVPVFKGDARSILGSLHSGHARIKEELSGTFRFLVFGGVVPYRPVEDIAFAVARFFQRGGTFQNYYMYHGGTNFGRTTGGPFIATSYDYDAPIDEYGFLRQPKWGHLKDVHKAIKLCEQAMVATDPTISSLGSNLEASVYKTGSGLCVAFLANIGTQSEATVNFNGNSYQLPPWKGNSNNAKVSIDVPITLIPRKNKIDLLSLTVGLQNYGALFDEEGAGITGPVKLTGLKGEELGLSNGGSSAWVSGATLPKEQPLIWYKTTFDTPSGTIPVALDFTGMGKGEAFVNGQSIGRYWPTYIAPSSGCTDSCNYKGSYSSNKCLKNCGKPSQQLVSGIENKSSHPMVAALIDYAQTLSIEVKPERVEEFENFQ
ncbi:hypothetical protein RHGRI_003753 [Rhododendron griersonianum]|uniref:beta-galactosidase n=1 Tax=Rhododendron griersonianum TaxID=479676 RepID=A0AAV6L745_9ERIC|nr:hypothetical protein RHGRI_003753 [Rhododendron griersonianum]